MTLERITHQGKEILILGTAHISEESIVQVNKIIEEEKPDTVGVELDAPRLKQLDRGTAWRQTNILQLVREGKTFLLLLSLLLHNMQKSLGEQVGVAPGAEMKAAADAARRHGSTLALLDRDVRITISRALKRMSFFEKLKLLGGIVMGLFEEQKPLTKDIVEELKKKDTLNRLIEEFARQMPRVKEVLVDERDAYIATRILQMPGDKVLAVVGAGHTEGIKKRLDHPVELAPLEQVHAGKSRFHLLKWAVPVIFVTLLAYTFMLKGLEGTATALLLWVLINGVLSALGALLAGARWQTIIVAFFAAPFTSLHPLVAAGWFAAYAEAHVAAPQVRDFEGLSQLRSYGDFSNNRVTHLLLVAAYANVGSVIGTLVAFPFIVSLLA